MKFTPQILRAKPPTGSAFNFFLDPRAKKFCGVRWHAKKCVCALQAFNPHFSVLALTTFFICPFALMQKNEKIKAKRMLRRLAGPRTRALGTKSSTLALLKV
ncbi:hypothetical protein [Niabella hirudinis]|uniref:hypothetical protein n=1 Tax=Niabella hirudinis TaxID=1285929 RepID=UPI003EB85960